MVVFIILKVFLSRSVFLHLSFFLIFLFSALSATFFLALPVTHWMILLFPLQLIKIACVWHLNGFTLSKTYFLQCRAPAGGKKLSMPYMMQYKYHHISEIKMIVTETINKTWKDLHFFAISRERYSKKKKKFTLNYFTFKKLFVKTLRK